MLSNRLNRFGIVNAPGLCLQAAYNCFRDSLYAKFIDRIQFRVELVFRFEVGWLTLFVNITFECCFTVNQSSYNITIARLTRFDDYTVTIVNFCIDHTFTPHLKRKTSMAPEISGCSYVDLQLTHFTRWFHPIRVTGCDGPQNRYVDHRCDIFR